MVALFSATFLMSICGGLDDVEELVFSGFDSAAFVLVNANRGVQSGGRVIADALLVALAANLANLFDRAPGRAIKVSLQP